MMTDAPDNCFDLRMQQRFTATDRYDRGLQIRQPINTPKHLIRGHGSRKIVIFVAIRTGEITTPNRYDVRQKDVFGGRQTSGNHLEFAKPQTELVQPLHKLTPGPRVPPYKLLKLSNIAHSNCQFRMANL